MAYSTVLRGSGATHVGRVRSKNDDRYLTHAELWVVADGMGGHRGGDVAARLACESLAQGLPAPSVEGLVDAIDAANQAVHNAGSSDPDLTGMGTTVVALALVNDSGEEVLAVASVGDSRVYRLTGGELEQLTEDHSLVADMVREGSLSPEEAATHPQRNILTRVLGVYDEIPVDVVTIIPHHGDRYLLCSDGLFNEVSEDGIGAVLRRLAEPADAADELVRLAVEAGGRDNVTVVVVDVVSDGNAAITASVALAGDNLAADADTTYSPGGAYADTTPDTDDIDAIRFRRLRSRNEDDADGGGGRHRGDRPRRLTWRVVLFTVLVLGVVGGALASVQWYGRSAYYVGFEGDRVAIFRGRPGGVWWVDPTLVDTTRLDRNEVPADTVDALVSGKEVASLEEATQYVDRLEERVFRAKEEANQTTTTVPTTTLPTTTVPTTTLPVP